MFAMIFEYQIIFTHGTTSYNLYSIYTATIVFHYGQELLICSSGDPSSFIAILSAR